MENVKLFLRGPLGATTEPCTIRVTGKESTQRFFAQTLFIGKALVGTISNTILNRRSAKGDHVSVPPGLLASELNITLGGAAVLGIKFAVPPNVTSARSKFSLDMIFGEAYQGIRKVNYVVDSGFLTGAIDGRVIVPQHAGLASNGRPGERQPDTFTPVKFRDGQPPPKIAVNPDLAAAMHTLLSSALPDAVANCHKLTTVSSRRRERGVEPSNGPPESDNSATCNACTNNCGEQLGICILAAVGACVESFGFGCIAIPACYAAAALCDSNCNETGAACCQQKCASGICCQSGDVCCGDSCCQAGAICSNGLCCTTDQPIGCGSEATGTCCAKGQSCADPNSGLCCNVGAVACGGSCCSSASKCINGSVCCDGGIICGTSCCRDGSQCNRQTGQCGLSPCGNSFCTFQECCNGVCCQFNQACVNGVCTGATCPSGTLPCRFTPGQCCPPNFICCSEGQCCNPATQICCGGGRGCLPSASGGCGF